MFSPFGARSTLSRNSGNVTQSHGIPAFMDSYGIASVRVMVSIARSRSSGGVGANPNPQFPITTDVMPCQPEIVRYGSQKSWAS